MPTHYPATLYPVSTLSKNPYQYDIDQAVEEFLERAGIEVEAPLNLGNVVVDNAAAEGGIVDGRPRRAVLYRDGKNCGH